MTTTRNRYRQALMLAAAAAALAMPALAQTGAAPPKPDPAAPANEGSEEVIVTSRSRKESLQKVPIAITAITQQLKSADVRDVRDIVAYTPNVRIDGIAQRSNAPSINIRGISPSRTDDNSIDSPIGVLIDGIFLGSLPGQIIENFDVERIEILRGPQGTLFGRNTVGGALNVVRTEPTGEWGGKAQYTTGSWDLHEFRAVVNAPIIDGILAAKGFYFSSVRDGFVRNTTLNIDMPQKDYVNFGVTFKYTPTENFKALLTLERYDDDSQGGAFISNYNVAPGVLPPSTGPSDINAPGSAIGPGGGLIDIFLPGILSLPGLVPLGNVPPRTDLSIPKTISTDFSNPGSVETDAVTLNMSYQLSDRMEVVSVTGYRKQRELASEDFDGSSADFITISTDADYDQFSQEVRLQGDFDTSAGAVSYVLGAYYFENSFTRDWVTGGDFWEFVDRLGGYSLANNVWLNPASPIASEAATGFATPVAACIAPRTTPALQAVFGLVRCDPTVTGAYGPKLVAKLFEEQDTRTYAGFGHADWEFVPNFTLTLGLRYTYEEKDFTGFQAYQTPLALVDDFNFPDSISLSNNWSQWTPMAALAWQMTPDVLWYASFSKGWHSGGFFGVNQNTADFESNQYAPERATSYELGMKGRFFDRRVTFNVALFRNDFVNKQESAIVFDDRTNTVVTLFTNVGGLRYQGAEAELQWAVDDRLNIAASFGYLDAEYTELLIGYPGNKAGPVPIVDATFLVPRNAPEFTAGASVNYTLPLGPGYLTLGAKIAWVDSVYGDLYNASTSFVDAHEDVSAIVSYEYENYKVSVFGRNLTDWEHESPVFIAPLFASGTFGPGASWGLEVSASF